MERYNPIVAGLSLRSKFRLSLALVVVTSVVIYVLGEQLSQESIRSFIERFGVFAPIIYILLHQISYIIAPISGIPYLIVGFYLFGPNVIVYNYLVAVLGSVVNFYIARKWGRRWVLRFAGKEVVEKIDKVANRYGVVSLISFRLMHLGIGDFVSYAYGFTSIKFSTYFVIGILAMLPSSIVWYIVAQRTNSIEQFFGVTMLLLVIAIAIFYLGNFVWKRNSKRSELRD